LPQAALSVEIYSRNNKLSASIMRAPFLCGSLNFLLTFEFV